MSREFPILRGARRPSNNHLRWSIPWEMIAPHEAQAQANHGQTLERLAERGGLSPGEAFAVLTGARWPEYGAKNREQDLDVLVREWEARALRESVRKEGS